jgi:hypothetical protein
MDDEQRVQFAGAIAGLSVAFPALALARATTDTALAYGASMLGFAIAGVVLGKDRFLRIFYACLGPIAGAGATFTASRFAASYTSFPVIALVVVAAVGAGPALAIGWLVTTVRKGYPQG